MYSANSKEYREALESIIQADGPSAEAAASILQELNELLPPESAIERRIESLEHILKNNLIGEHTANATTVLDGYQSGRLKYVAGHYYVFRDGQMLAGPRRPLNFDEEKMVFDEFGGPIGLWIEFVGWLKISSAGFGRYLDMKLMHSISSAKTCRACWVQILRNSDTIPRSVILARLINIIGFSGSSQRGSFEERVHALIQIFWKM